MAKVIRKQWVWKKQGHNYRYLPRRNDGKKQYDFEASETGPDHFPERIAQKSHQKAFRMWTRTAEGEARRAREKGNFGVQITLPGGKIFIFLAEEPPKLWLAWIYREPEKEPKLIKDWLKKLFGDDYKVGKMEIFKNTASQNKSLWHVKHIIELKPLRFPNGEPTLEDVTSLEVLYDGTCIIDKTISCNEFQIAVRDPTRQWTPGQLQGRLRTRYRNLGDIFEDTVYNPSNITIVN